jgi:hypothetical protein
VNIDSGARNVILDNTFTGDRCGIHLWSAVGDAFRKTPWARRICGSPRPHLHPRESIRLLPRAASLPFGSSSRNGSRVPPDDAVRRVEDRRHGRRMAVRPRGASEAAEDDGAPARRCPQARRSPREVAGAPPHHDDGMGAARPDIGASPPPPPRRDASVAWEASGLRVDATPRGIPGGVAPRGGRRDVASVEAGPPETPLRIRRAFGTRGGARFLENGGDRGRSIRNPRARNRDAPRRSLACARDLRRRNPHPPQRSRRARNMEAPSPRPRA